ncbi:MAG: S1C family serine protease [Planctomycetia bacterium]|nr:S1C family serine protease [Planctomycetia bacterium]
MVALCFWGSAVAADAKDSVGDNGPHSVLDRTQSKIVKVFGAGGLRGLKAYQSGMLISPAGHVLTAYSYVLDTDSVTVVLDDGRRFEAKLVGADPRLEIAVLKCEATDLPCFDLTAAVEGRIGTRVLALSNLFGVATGDEQASVQHGVISALSTLSARHGVFSTPYRGSVYVLDAMTNNPGAAGGALTDSQGRLLGILGKELRNTSSNLWLNYAIPISELRPAIEDILAGKSRPQPSEIARRPRQALDLAGLGLLLVPNVTDATPPYVESVQPDSPAAHAGLAPDDLILFINGRLVQSLHEMQELCRTTEAGGRLEMTIRRGAELKVIAIEPKVIEPKASESQPAEVKP